MKKALLVGINRYPVPGNELMGCVNDVHQMANTLKDGFGFPGGGQMRILTDARATTKAILDGLSWLTDGASPGDSLVFHYSGHGSRVPDENGDETTDGQDEILCPYDLDWDHPLTDDDLAQVCARVPEGALLTVVLDCCHSGTGLREAPAPERVPVPLPSGPASAGARLVAATVPPVLRVAPPVAVAVPPRSRFLPPPRAARSANVSMAPSSPSGPGSSRPVPAAVPARRRTRRFGVCVTNTNAVLIAACRDAQTSADAWIDGAYHGAHTYHLCRALREARRIPTYRGLVAAAGTALARAGFDQVPQLEGPVRLLGNPVFHPPAAAGDARRAV